MKNDIVILGDSFTFGQGCSDRLWYWDPKSKTFVGDTNLGLEPPSKYCWASKLADDFQNYNVINLAKPGIDNIYLANAGQNHINDNTKLVIYSSPPSIRIQAKHHLHDTPVSWPIADDSDMGNNPNQEYKLAKKLFVKHLYHQDILTNISINCILSVYAASIKHGAKFILACAEYELLSTLSKLFTEVYEEHKMDSLVYLIMKKYPEIFKSKDRHANDLGHTHYYETVVKPLVSTYL